MDKGCSTCEHNNSWLCTRVLECAGTNDGEYVHWIPKRPTTQAKPVADGGSHASYYELEIEHPKSGAPAYMAECQDIIEALKMDFNEGNALKALWRRAAARLGKVKKGNDDTKYDADKIAFYGDRIRLQEERKRK